MNKPYSWQRREKRLPELLKQEGENLNAHDDFTLGLKLAAQGEQEQSETSKQE